MNFKRVILLDLASLGIGEANDANRYDSIGADTLRHVIEQAHMPVKLTNLSKLGLGNLFWQNPIDAIPLAEEPDGFFGRIQISSTSNTDGTGIREMFDYQDRSRTASVLDSLPRQHSQQTTVLISYFHSYFANQEAAQLVDIDDDMNAFATLDNQLQRVTNGLMVVRLTDLEKASNSADANQFVNQLNVIDVQIGHVFAQLHDDDLVLITSSYANDFTRGYFHLTREYLPLIAYSPRLKVGHSLGIRRSLGDIAKTLIDNFSIVDDPTYALHGFLGEMQ